MRSNRRKIRKLFILFLIIFITSVVLIYETYAWFVGISSVSVEEFTVSVGSESGLELSLDGSTWDDDISIDPATIENIYNNNSNKWPTSLIPVSTIGEMNISSSKLKFYEKSSLIANYGGHYILSSQVSNTSTEADKYVAFDLFIRNGKSSAYIGSTYNIDDEEDIFLAGGSYAITNVSGTEPNYGAANSVRVGFFEIGRVASNGYSVSAITGASCNSSSGGVKPLCVGSTGMTNPSTNNTYTIDELQGSTWNIWEPNYASHTANLVSYYNDACRMRSPLVPNGERYWAKCLPIRTGTSKKTYAIKAPRTTLDDVNSNNRYNVNIYDGGDINQYNLDYDYIKEMKTYKMSDATSTGATKYPLIKLAGNSITKVRVYIWLEGQDIDNYDLISENSSVIIKFGFTKDRHGLSTANNNAINNRTPSFQEDSWAKIKENVHAGTTNAYNVGDMRTVRINGKEYRLRIANKSSPTAICNNSTNSQTACGFVVEFLDVVNTRQMIATNVNSGGYPQTLVYSYLKDTMFNQLPIELQSVIATTRVVSGHGSSGSSDFTTSDKLYLLSYKELNGGSWHDTSDSKTRQLDYYVGQTNPAKYERQIDGYYNWWTRTADSNRSDSFIYIGDDDGWTMAFIGSASSVYGVAPAFRID